MALKTSVVNKYVPGKFAPFNFKVMFVMTIGTEVFKFRYINPEGRRLVSREWAEAVRHDVEHGGALGDQAVKAHPSLGYSQRVATRSLTWNQNRVLFPDFPWQQRRCKGFGVVLQIGPHRFNALNSHGDTIRTFVEEDAFLKRFERAMDSISTELLHDDPL